MGSQEAAGEYMPEGLEVQVPQVAPGCVQLSSGRIARPTPKTAPSRASSAELSETFPSDGQFEPPHPTALVLLGLSHIGAPGAARTNMAEPSRPRPGPFLGRQPC